MAFADEVPNMNDALRERFEKWVLSQSLMSVEKDGDGEYKDHETWYCWQAALAMHSTGDDARDTERLNWLESTMREYGDGYTEPREASIEWIGWQQSPEESHFPGLRKAIDAAITGAQGHE
jgi:hypothetical protein